METRSNRSAGLAGAKSMVPLLALVVAVVAACSPSGPAPSTPTPASGPPASAAASLASAPTEPNQPATPSSAALIGVSGPASVPIVAVLPTEPPPAGASVPSAAPLPPGYHALSGTNLALAMPGKVSVDRMDFGGPGFLVRGEEGCEVVVRPVDPGLPRTLDEVRFRIQNDAIRWRKFERIEGSPQGWVIEYETDGLTDPKKAAYGVNVRKNVDGDEVACSRILETQAAAKCALAACQSLRHLP
jgi:hypothetical protein